MGKQLRFDDAARDSLRRGVDQLAGAVRVTLGPRGRNVVIDRGQGLPTITNDGLVIAREIVLSNPFENMGVQLVKEVALKTGEAAGDGTTTATVLAHSIVSRGLQAVTSGHNPVAVKRGIDRAVVLVVEELQRQSRPVRESADVARVATLSAQDDPRIGTLVADAMDRVGRLGVITVSEGRGMESTLEVVEGMTLARGYVSPYFITDPESMTVSLENALVLLTEFKLATASQMLPILELAATASRPLVVVADDIEGEALATLVVNRLRGTLPSVAIRAPGMGERRREQFEDLAVFTGAKLFAADLGTTLDRFEARDFGRVQRVVVERETATFMLGGGKAAGIRERLTSLERELARNDSEYERSLIRDRIGRLKGGVAVIHVGAPTELEMQERKARVEDALAATRSAVEEGVVPGGGVALLRSEPALAKLHLKGDEQIGVEIIRKALQAPASQIAENAGWSGAIVVQRIREGEGAFGWDAVSGNFGDLEKLGIVDPTKVTRCALQHAASIGSLVLTTDAIVVETEEDEAAGPPTEEQ